MKQEETLSPTLHLQRLQLLLRMEYEYEKEEFKRQTEAMGVSRKVKRGLCWYPVQTGRTYYNSLNQLVLEVTRTEDIDIEHEFEYGRPLCFFRQHPDGTLSYYNFIATVSYADDRRMVVVMPNAGSILDVQGADHLGVQRYFDETSYHAMFEALEEVVRCKGNRLAELKEKLLGNVKPEMRQLYPVRFPWLNPTQEGAVNKVLCAKDVAIVHGPPGTGKTTTLVEAIYETLHREPQVLVCAQSNMAVDWISEKLVDRGVNVLRIGNPTRVNDKMLSFTYERRFENHPSYPELWSIRKELRHLSGQTRRGSYEGREALRSKMSRLRDRATALEVQINADLFDSAHVIASTLVSSSHRLLAGHRFGTLFIDEAAQALEAACWIAIRKADRVVLAFLVEAYDEEVVDAEKNDTRVVMHFHPALAPFKCAVLPLSKKLGPAAQDIYAQLSKDFMVDYDEAGSIGKRYRRQDEIGTPFCITVDFQTVGDEKTPADHCVTVRDRDSMEQIRLPISELKDYIARGVAF